MILGDFIPADVFHSVSAGDVSDSVGETAELIGIAPCPNVFVFVMLDEMAIL